MVLRDRDANTAWPAESDYIPEERRYYSQNRRADVVAILTDAGAQVEQVRYSAYGVPFGLPAGDVDSDGDTDATDVSAISGWSSGYDVRYDVNLDGAINSTDTSAATAVQGTTLGRGVLSRNSSGNRIGYAGYRWDETCGKYQVRNRVFDPESGRWHSRDPLSYISTSLNLYEYTYNNPVDCVDPLGLLSSSSSGKKPSPPAVPGTVPVPPGAIPGAPLNPQKLGDGGIGTFPQRGKHPTGHSIYYVKDPSCPSGYRYASQGTDGFEDGDLGDYLRERSPKDEIYLDPVRGIRPRDGLQAIDDVRQEDPPYRVGTKCNDIVCRLLFDSTGQDGVAGGGVLSPEKLRDRIKEQSPGDGTYYPPGVRPPPTPPSPPAAPGGGGSGGSGK